ILKYMGTDAPDRRPAGSAPEAHDPENTYQAPRTLRETTTDKRLKQFPAPRAPVIFLPSDNAFARRASGAAGVLSLAVAQRQSCRLAKDEASHARPLLSGPRHAP